jgi:hypothetical protein
LPGPKQSSLLCRSVNDENDEKVSVDVDSSLETLKNRQPKFFFENGSIQILSIYKCVNVEHNDKSNVTDPEFLSFLSKFPSPDFNPKWAILVSVL